MKGTILISFILLISLTTSGQGNDTLMYLLYTPDVCPACKQVIQQASNQKNRKINLVVSERHADFDSLIRIDIGSYNVNIIYSDSLFTFLSSNRIDVPITQPLLQTFDPKTNRIINLQIKESLNVVKETFKIPQKIKIPENTKICSDKSDWIMVNNIDRYSIIQWIEMGDTSNCFQLKLYDSLTIINLIAKLSALDPEVQRNYELLNSWTKKVQRMLPSFITCESFSVYKDTTYFILNVLAFNKKGIEKYEQSRNLFIAKFFNRDLVELCTLNDHTNRKKGYLNPYNNFFVINDKRIVFTTYLLTEKYKAYPLLIDMFESETNTFYYRSYLRYKLHPGFKNVLCSNQNAANYGISCDILFYNYFNEIYDISKNISIVLSTEYAKTDSIVLSKPTTEWPVWQFGCIRKAKHYYSFVRLNGEYFLIKYTQHGVEINREKIEYSVDRNNFPVVGVSNDKFIILNHKSKEITELIIN